jgi:hypothetical protein
MKIIIINEARPGPAGRPAGLMIYLNEQLFEFIHPGFLQSGCLFKKRRE